MPTATTPAKTKTTVVQDTAPKVSLQDKFNIFLPAAMSDHLVEREEAISIFKLCLLTGLHAFFLGEPGIAKSMLLDTGISLIDGLDPDNDYFYILFFKSTTREDVFGPLSLPLLKEGRYKFLTEGYLPKARIGFVDEVWKGNAGIQNSLLLISNERRFRNDGKVEEAPMHCMFFASNELPEDDSTAAMFDRIHFKLRVQRIREPGNFQDMLKMQTRPKVGLQPVLTWDEIMEAHRQVREVIIPANVLETLVEVREGLADQSIFPSDRKFAQALRIVQAQAWLDGETVADPDHLRPLEWVLFNDFDHAPIVRTMLYNLVSPWEKEISKILEGVNALDAEVSKAVRDGLDIALKEKVAVAIYDKTMIAFKEITDIHEKIKESGARRTPETLGNVARRIRSLSTRILVELFETTPDEVALADFDFTAILGDD